MKYGEQITVNDWLRVPEPGETTTDETRIGRPLSWEDACNRIGSVIWYKHIMESRHYYEALRPEKFCPKLIPYYVWNGDGHDKIMIDRLICFNGHQQRSLINQIDITRKYKYPEGGAFYEVRG